MNSASFDFVSKCIDSEYMYNEKRTLEEDSPRKAKFVHQGRVMEGLLVEKGSEESFEEAMKKFIKKSQIYVGIFGNSYSERTREEYEFALKLGLPLLVYYFTDPPKIAIGSHSKVARFLQYDVKDDKAHIRGNYGRIEAHDPTELIDIVLSDLACKVLDIVREGIDDRRMLLEKAPDATIGAIVRTRKNVFE